MISEKQFLKLVILLLGFLSLLSKLNAQNNRATGYKGIWFALRQPSKYGDKYSVGLGTYTSSHIPIPIYPVKVNKTFFVFL